jgi:hypothetical protein
LLLIFFPEKTSGTGWGGPACDAREKTLVFRRESPKMQALGVKQTSSQLCLPFLGIFRLGRQTDSVKIPQPRNQLNSVESSAGPRRIGANHSYCLFLRWIRLQLA